MEHKYSLAIHPSETVIELIKSMKLDLAQKVGWFHSKNSVAHITICNFTADDTEINSVKDQINELCNSIKPVEVHLNGFGSYSNGAFFIAPDESSNKSIMPIMKRFNETLHLRNMQINNEPHISIARRLSPRKLETAKQLFTKIDTTFLFDHVVLRKFDENVKQYSVTDTFMFRG